MRFWDWLAPPLPSVIDEIVDAIEDRIPPPSVERFRSLVRTKAGGMAPEGFLRLWGEDRFQEIFRDGLLFCNYDSGNCEVWAYTDPSASIVRNHKGRASIVPSESVLVYQSGEWKADGPWCEKINRILDDIEIEWREMEAAEKAAERENNKEKEKTRQERLKAAADAIRARG